ncbi:hypothetical protein EDB85DRAFT_1528868 [Lactarius pseudohatsudake]|nr:hypothetical protein EDB85DRAFT_1528868 [Lactarius pseudohatsudake]
MTRRQKQNFPLKLKKCGPRQWVLLCGRVVVPGLTVDANSQAARPKKGRLFLIRAHPPHFSPTIHYHHHSKDTMQPIYSNATHMTSFLSRTSAPSLDEDQTAMWSLTTGCAQPQAGSGFTSDRKAVSQQQYGTSHTFPETTTTGFGCGPDVDWNPAAALWGTPEGVLGIVTNDLNRPYPGFASWITPTPPLTDISSAVSPWSTSTVSAGIVPSSLNQAPVAYSGTVPPESRGLALPRPSGDPSWLLEPNPFTGMGSSYIANWGSSQGQIAPGYTGVSSEYDYTGIGNTLYYPGQWCPTGPFGPDSSTANIEAGLPMVSALTPPGVILGKRPRASGTDGAIGRNDTEAEGYGCYDPRQKKKVRGLILGVSGSLSRAQHKSVTRNPNRETNHKSKAVEHDAGGHAATSAQGLYGRFLTGPSVQQQLSEATTQGLTWVEESAHGEEPRKMGGTWKQQQQAAQNGAGAEEARQHFPIPRSLRERYSKLLAATEADWERGAVNELRCRVCPGARFSKWEGFKRHCDTTRVHPWDIYICDHCGDYFGRSDSFMRHSRRRPRVCQKAVPERAGAKGRDIRRLHEDFKARMVRCLNDGGDIGVPFFRIVKAKYPSSSENVVEDIPSEYD